jgi:antitoxin (DNA-binding transcriptional repressor) of toxin-antitoxin stability system
MKTLRMPVSSASRKGVSGVVSAAGDARVVLTSHGRPVAVVDSADRLDDDVRRMREASLAVVDSAAFLVSTRTKKFDLDEVCARLGIDSERVRNIAAERAAQ